MNKLNEEIQEIKKLIDLENFDISVKKIIDLTLDSKNISFYKRTINLLNWLDYHMTDKGSEKKEKILFLLEELYDFFRNISQKGNSSLIEVNFLKKSYSRSSFGLGPVSFSLQEGEMIGLVGENGNGKTTLLRLISKDLLPTDGGITYNFYYRNRYDLRTKLVYIPQRTQSWRGSLMDNLLFAAVSYGTKPKEAVLIVDLIISRMGLRNYKKHAWKDLSSGYKMRFELARAMLRNPKILLIDEPLANLDILAQQTVLEDLKMIAKSKYKPIGIIFSSQQLYEVEKVSDSIIFLRNGEQFNLNSEEENNLTVEFESSLNQDELEKYFLKIAKCKFVFNGSTYIVEFEENIPFNKFLEAIVQNKINVTYLRDITKSTRKLFV